MNTGSTSSTSGTPRDIDELAGEYVLGTLSSADHDAVRTRMLSDAALRAAVQVWEERLLPLTALSAPVEPSERLWGRIARSTREAQSTRAAPSHGFNWRSLTLWRSLSATGFSAAAILAAVLFSRPADNLVSTQFLVVLAAPQDKTPGWVIQASNSHEVELIPLGVAQVPTDKALEFWTKGDGWNGPVSLGLVKPGQTLRINLDKLPPMQNNQLFELTLEPKSGSTVGKPTGPVQFIGRAVKVI
jgi:anti-sigma-K factor RskA